MDWQSLASVLVFIFLTAVLVIKRKRFEFHGKFPWIYAGMLRTKLGLRLMNWGADKLGWLIRPLSTAGIYVGFLGMGFIVYEIVKSAVLLLISPETAPSVQPVLPIQAKGVFFVPFLFWVLAIFIIAVVHEFSHGVVARSLKIKVKSSGFAFLGIILPLIPAAFVEPDERQMKKRRKKDQLAVFAAGPFANILMSLVLIFLFGLQLPFIPAGIIEKTTIVDFGELSASLVDLEGLEVTEVVDGSPAAAAGLESGLTITAINDVSDQEGIQELLAGLTPGQEITLQTEDQPYPVTLGEHPEDAERGYIGMSFNLLTQTSEEALAKWGTTGVEAIRFIIGLTIWVIFLGLGIGLFNLVPIGPIDGGRMLLVALKHFMSDARAQKIWKSVSYVGLGLILVNIFVGFL